jgi:SAM-dependent methyltransferase
MVHALREAHRVLKPDGLLIDLRPAAVHRRVGITRAKSYRLRWVMRENFDDDRAADRAVAQVLREGWFRAEGRKRFACYRVMDNIEEFQEWLTDFVQKGKFPSHDWLVRLVERELDQAERKTKIVVSGPLVLRGLRKRGGTRL